MQKIFIDRKDTVAKIVGKILENEDKKITLVIPTGSVLKNSLSNFELLEREARVAGKSIFLESVDKDILEFAEKAGLEASHPLFKEDAKPRTLSDIVPLGGGPKEPKEEKIEIKTKKRAGGKKEEPKKEELKEDIQIKEESGEDLRGGKEGLEAIEEGKPAEAISQPEKRKRKISRRGLKILVIALAVILLVIAAGWGAGLVFGRAEIRLSFKKTPWQYQNAFSANKMFSKIDSTQRQLPLEVFIQDKNTTRLFPASGKAVVSQKATGRLTIYNAYSTSPQVFVAATRFMTPDGKIFRLDNQVVVPGATIKDGKIVPSSVEANVTADKPGEEYNLSPVDKLIIPGFKGTPKYNGFYGSLLKSTSGGFVGQKPVAIDQDIASAKDKTAESLKASLASTFLNSRPPEFKIFDKASEIKITKLVVNKETDQNGNFGVFGEAEFRALGFRETDVKAILQDLAAKDYPRLVFQDLKINYNNIKPDFNSGKMDFTVSADGILGPQLSESDLKLKLAGRQLSEARQLILALPDLTNAKISLWPFWLSTLPTAPNKINIVFN